MRKTRVIALVFLLALLLSWSARADFEELMMDGVIVNCNEYVLKEGDLVEWLYTRNIGKDIGNEYMGD